MHFYLYNTLIYIVISVVTFLNITLVILNKRSPVRLEFCKRSCFFTFPILDTQFLTAVATWELPSDDLPDYKNI